MNKIYRLVVNSDYGFQLILNDSNEELLQKDLYSECKLESISFILDPDSKPMVTDVLLEGSLSMFGIPISNKLYNILINFNLCDIQFVDIQSNNLNNYKFMFFNSDLTNKIDYIKSDFILIEDILGDIKKIDVEFNKDRNSILNIDKEYCLKSIFYKLQPKKCYKFMSDFNILKKDVFRIGHFDMSFYISENLKNVLEKNKITGINYIEEPLFCDDNK